jgi:hypothetical protein
MHEIQLSIPLKKSLRSPCFPGIYMPIGYDSTFRISLKLPLDFFLFEKRKSLVNRADNLKIF